AGGRARRRAVGLGRPDRGLGRAVRARRARGDRVGRDAHRLRRRARARAGRPRRGDGRADAARAARRGRGRGRRADRAGDGVDPRGVPAHRLSLGGRPRPRPAPPGRAAARLPRRPRAPRPMTCVGYGKIILLGEHAVVYGYPALASALDRGVTVAPVPTPAGGPLRFELRSWDVAVSAGAPPPVARSLAAIADALDAGRPPVSLIGDAQLPPGAGLGSSAALAVAVARALHSHLR